MSYQCLVWAGSVTVMLLLVGNGPTLGQEGQDPHDTVVTHSGAEHEFHHNHFGGLVGVSTHHGKDDSAKTLGLDYARQFSKRWAVIGYLELVSSKLERDIVVATGAVFYPIRALAIVLAPGVESVDKEVEVHGEVETENELELLIRMGATYGFSVTPEASVGPAVFADWAGSRWTSLVGIGITVGF